MVNPSTLPYESLLNIYLEDRRLKRKITRDHQLRDLELKKGTEMVLAGRFYIRKHSFDYAITWLERAGNHPQALYTLGLLYLNQAKLAPNSREKARQYFTKSQNSASCYSLGMIYNGGLGVAKNQNMALRWFVRGALKGLRKAKYEAGMIYLQDARRSRESAKLSYYWLSSATNKRKRAKNDKAAKGLRQLVRMLDYDIESLAKNYKPRLNTKRIHTIKDNHEDEDDNDNDESDNDDDSDDEMGTRPKSSALAASKNNNNSNNNNNNNMAQAQSSFIFPSNSPPSFMSASNNMFQPESSSMALSRHNNMIQTSSPFMAATNDTIQSQSSFIPLSSNISQPETSFMAASNINMTLQNEDARTKQLEHENIEYKRTIGRLERENNDLKKTIDGMEKLFYWVAQNDVNNH